MDQQKIVQPLYFGGKLEKRPNEHKWISDEDFLQSDQAFFLYLVQIWAPQNSAPTELPALAEFGFRKLRPEYEAFLKSGGKLPKRGNTVEEQWMLMQLGLRIPHLCLLNITQPEQSLIRISRLRRLTATEIWTEMETRYANSTLDQLSLEPITVMIFDGSQVAHIVLAYTIWNNELHYTDSWPGRSLLCLENNAADISARKSNLINPGWRITAQEFQRVVFAAILSTRKIIPLTMEEQESARRETIAMEMARQLNKRNESSIQNSSSKIEFHNELEFAALTGWTWRAKIALNNGADINEKGSFGTPLHIAAAHGHLEIVRLLVREGADYLALDSAGKTPVEVAADNQHLEIVHYLLSLKKKQIRLMIAPMDIGCNLSALHSTCKAKVNPIEL